VNAGELLPASEQTHLRPPILIAEAPGALAEGGETVMRCPIREVEVIGL
jgi:hypothetical protein